VADASLVGSGCTWQAASFDQTCSVDNDCILVPYGDFCPRESVYPQVHRFFV
jgi:hypothetical protein